MTTKDEKPAHNNTTITLSIPHALKEFLDQLGMDGYNRSNLLIKLIAGIVQELYIKYPTVQLPRGIERVAAFVSSGELSKRYHDKALDEKIKELIREHKP